MITWRQTSPQRKHPVSIWPIVAAASLLLAMSAAIAQDTSGIPYCQELEQLNNLAMSKGRFAPVIGSPREGNFHETKLPLTGWMNCAFYGPATYTCDSPEFKTEQDAKAGQSQIAKDILRCFAGTWAQAPEQTSTDFLVLHPKLGSASITLNLDRTDGGHIVRLILFLRRG